MTNREVPLDGDHREDEYGRRVAHAVHEMIHPAQEITENPTFHEI